MTDSSPRCLVLDAMGVLFAAADDVAELLIPFIHSVGGESDARVIESAYLEASVGRIDADAFWARVGLDPDVERAYLSKHSLAPGALEFLLGAHRAGLPRLVSVERRRPVVAGSARVAWHRAFARRRCHQQRCQSPQARSRNLRASPSENGLIGPAELLFIRRSSQERNGCRGSRHSGGSVHGTHDYTRLSAKLFGQAQPSDD